MGKELITIPFNATSIRVITIDDQPWFVARDVLQTLGLTNMTEALANISLTDIREQRLTNTQRERPKQADQRTGPLPAGDAQPQGRS